MATVSRRRFAPGNSQPLPVVAKSSDRTKGRTKTVKVKVAGFKPHPNPYGESQGQQYSFKLLANAELRKALGDDKQQVRAFLDQWMEVNPREQKLSGPIFGEAREEKQLTGSIMKNVAETWEELPREFFRVNRGLVISAESITYDNETGIAQIVLTDPKNHGIVDGAHTFRKVVEHLIPATYGDDEEEEEDGSEVADQQDSEGLSDLEVEEEERRVEPDRYLACEVWTGLTLDQVALLTQGRNTSRSVPPYAIMQMKGAFQPLEVVLKSLKPKYYQDVVAFKPYEHVEIEGEDKFKPVSVLEILQLLMAMDINNYDANSHPIQAYKNRGFAPKFYTERMDEYLKMLPLIGDFLMLFDRLRQEVPEAYDDPSTRRGKLPRRWKKVLTGKTKKGEKRRKVDVRQDEPLYYLDPSGETKVFKAPDALFFPMISAFRADLTEVSGTYRWWDGHRPTDLPAKEFLKEVSGKYQWCDGRSPTDWPAEEFHSACQRLAPKIAQAANDKDSLHAVGRDNQVWANCYETLSSFLFENGRKKKA